MTSTLRLDSLRIPAALPEAGPLPILTLLPYTEQGRYTRERTERTLPAVVLENSRLTATFLPTLGGRLWSLVHRPSGRELLHRNPILQPANLALRNAWVAGGVEWNSGTTGHHPLSCAPLHAVRTERADGTPVLRMYEFERMRRLVFQLDAWLPPGSPLLHVQVTLHNPGPEVVPVYWWSNAAVPETPGTRVLAPARRAQHFGYSGQLRRVPFPGPADLSYPGRADTAADWFFDLPGAVHRPWIAALDADGSGLLQLSTSRLRGRKLFHWGTGPGGRRWQEWLSGPDAPYLEIQSGLAATQSEHLPMPGHSRWRWTEGYGLLQADARAVHGEWARAITVVGQAVREVRLDTTALPHDRPPLEVLHQASGWGALEQLAGGLPVAPGLPFPPPEPEQQPWRELLATGQLPMSDPPAAPVTGRHWRELLEPAEDWHALYQLGLLELAEGRPKAARDAWQRSLARHRTAWTLRALAQLPDTGQPERADLLSEAHGLLRDLPELTIEALTALLAAQRPSEALALIDALPTDQRLLGRVRLLSARAAVATGVLGRAAAILADLEVPDLREGEHALDALWFELHAARLAGGGPVTDELRALARAEFPLPRRYDFRMHL